jgi:hypothetical protein
MFTHKLWRKALAVGVSSTLVLHLFAYQLPTAVAAENEEVQQNESIDPCQEDNLFEIVVVNLFGCKVKLHGYKFEDTNANQQWDDGEAGIADWAMYAEALMSIPVAWLLTPWF